MDVHVRLWNLDHVKTHYLTSVFMGHASASDIYEELEPLVRDLGFRIAIQLSMDGPNVNWKVYNTLQEQIEKQTGTCKMLNAGSCAVVDSILSTMPL